MEVLKDMIEVIRAMNGILITSFHRYILQRSFKALIDHLFFSVKMHVIFLSFCHGQCPNFQDAIVVLEIYAHPHWRSISICYWWLTFGKVDIMRI